jgi:hypothetical protein
MAGWYKEQDTTRSAVKTLRGALPRARGFGFRRGLGATIPEAQTVDATHAASALREEHVSLVAAYISSYPDDAEERINCNRRLHEQPQHPAT